MPARSEPGQMFFDTFYHALVAAADLFAALQRPNDRTILLYIQMATKIDGAA